MPFKIRSCFGVGGYLVASEIHWAWAEEVENHGGFTGGLLIREYDDGVLKIGICPTNILI